MSDLAPNVRGGRLRGAIGFAMRVWPSSRANANVLWNIAGGSWTAGLIIAVTPFYVARLGLEGYGVVGFWLALQVMLGILDIGMSVTLMRGFAGAVSTATQVEFRHNLLRTFELITVAVGAIAGAALFASAGWIASEWLTTSGLSARTLTNALCAMAVALAFQSPLPLYSSGLAGLQKQGRMNALQMAGGSLRYGGGAAVLLWKPDLVWFFGGQIIASLAHTLATRAVLRHAIGSLQRVKPAFRRDLIRQTWRYSAGMSISGIGAVLMANADRLALSALRPATELGKYSLAFTVTGLLQLAIQPFYRAFFPRYSELVSLARADELRAEYFRSCQLIAALIVPLGILATVFAPHFLFVWLGRADPTVVLVLRWLIVGLSTSGLMWLPAALQQAHGWTRLHASMIIASLVVGAPLMVWAIHEVGTVGATIVWVLHGMSGLTLELWLMHRRLLPGDLAVWYRTVIMPPIVFALPFTVLFWWLTPTELDRLATAAWLALAGAVTIGTALAASRVLGDRVRPATKAEALNGH